MKALLIGTLLIGSFSVFAKGGTPRVTDVIKTRNGVKVELTFTKIIPFVPIIGDRGLPGPSSWHKTVSCKVVNNELIASVEYERKAVIDRGQYIQDQYSSHKIVSINVNKLCAEGVPTIVEVNGKRVI